ncbi:hypothetical protein D3Z46_15450 [Bacteroides sartorii]|nr:hypothetical protein [Phocaeicola sartorii]
MVLRHSGRVGSRRFTELLRNNQVPEEFFYARPAESHRTDALHPAPGPAPEAVRTDGMFDMSII